VIFISQDALLVGILGNIMVLSLQYVNYAFTI